MKTMTPPKSADLDYTVKMLIKAYQHRISNFLYDTDEVRQQKLNKFNTLIMEYIPLKDNSENVNGLKDQEDLKYKRMIISNNKLRNVLENLFITVERTSDIIHKKVYYSNLNDVITKEPLEPKLINGITTDWPMYVHVKHLNIEALKELDPEMVKSVNEYISVLNKLAILPIHIHHMV